MSLADGFMDDLFPRRSPTCSLNDAAEKCGLEPALLERVWSAVGFSAPAIGEITEEDVALLRSIAAALESGFPLVAFLQLVRVYGQAPARIAETQSSSRASRRPRSCSSQPEPRRGATCHEPRGPRP